MTGRPPPGPAPGPLPAEEALPGPPGAGPGPAPLPVLFLVSTVVFPGGTAHAQIRTRPNLLQLAGHEDPETLFLFAFAPGADPERVSAADLRPLGVAGHVVSRMRLPDGSLQVSLQGIRRAVRTRWRSTAPVLSAEVTEARERPGRREVLDGLVFQVLTEVEALVASDEAYTGELARLLRANAEDPGRFADLVAMTVAFDLRDRVRVLEELDLERRLEVVSGVLRDKVEFARIAREIEHRAQEDIGKSQREYFLRQQMKAIRSELGEEAREEADARRLSARADEAGLPPEAEAAIRGEIARLRGTNPASSEYGVTLTWLDWALSLPWSAEGEDSLDLGKVRRALEEDHHGLEKPKARILEFLAVRAAAPEAPGPVLCFTGPPGTGKTSLAQSVARAMGRKLVRISVGGVHDESQIRGHRRTYVGALPGRILQALRRAGVRNPVLVIDEVDKMGSGLQGDPAAALLEVLDPEQNRSFTDHYLDLPFDLSRVLFITTANDPWEIPGPLLDRMETVALRGYTEEEKVAIARRHLVPRVLAGTGLRGRLRIGTPVIRSIARLWTAEAGVRDLRRRLDEVARKFSLRAATGEEGPFRVSAGDLPSLLGPPPVHAPERRRSPEVGVATGLAWTGAGGDLLVIEGLRMPGTGGFQVTGSLGDVMKESIQAAASWVRAGAEALGLAREEFSGSDVHIHFPEGRSPRTAPAPGWPSRWSSRRSSRGGRSATTSP